MTETLTESFCERCGTRYTFESARPRARLKGVKVLSRGLKNFVLSDDTSMDEAMAAARSESDRETTAHQLDAFHRTFNFCMSCRQYTCPNCWNEVEARCLSCAPLALPEPPVLIDDLRALRAAVVIDQPASTNGLAAHDDEEAPAIAGLAAEAEVAEIELQPEPEVAMAAPTLEAADAEPELEAAAAELAPDVADDVAEPAPEPVFEAAAAIETVDEGPEIGRDAAGKAAGQTGSLLRRFRPGQSMDAELEAYERSRADDLSGEAPASLPEPAPESQLESESAEPLSAASGPSDVVEQPTWRITAPDAAGTVPQPPLSSPEAEVPLAASATAAESPSEEPKWPVRPQWPGAAPAAGLPFLGRPATPQGGVEALWAASNQELVTAPPVPGRSSTGIQPCVSCGLSLSANARFCRRCGTVQQR